MREIVKYVVIASVFICPGCDEALQVGTKDTQVQVWVADPLVKVFKEDRPAENIEGTVEASRGETATLQIVVRCEQAIEALNVKVDKPTLEGDENCILAETRVRFVGYVPVDRPMREPCKEPIHAVPGDFPDPLLEDEIIDVAGGQAQPIWIIIPVPTNAKAGLYRGRLHISGEVAGREQLETIDFSVRVYDVVVGPSRLWVGSPVSLKYPGKKDAELKWQEKLNLLRQYARNMAEHRYNIAGVPLNAIKLSVGNSGGIEADFSAFDRWIEIFMQEGVSGRITGTWLGKRGKGDWRAEYLLRIHRIKDGKVAGEWVEPNSVEADAYCSWFLPLLVTHLREKGWLGIYMQCVGDEPNLQNAASYRQIANLVRKYAPELRIAEAVHTWRLAGAVDVWIPNLRFLRKDFEHYKKRQDMGEELWFYTAANPQGEYANRHIEQCLIKTRLLHWINFRFGMTGYGRWGYNNWLTDNPFTQTTVSKSGEKYWPAGDAWIVYPGSKGPLDSIRHEAMRDGIADYELLCMLAERDKAAAQRLAERHILDFDKYNCDVKAFRETRRELLELLGQRPTQKAYMH